MYLYTKYCIGEADGDCISSIFGGKKNVFSGCRSGNDRQNR